MKKIIESRLIAAICLVLCVAAACTLGVRRSAKALEDDLLEAFRSSPEQYVSVRPALRDVSYAAHGLIDAAESLLGEDAAADLSNLTKAFDRHLDDPFGDFTPNDLLSAAKALYGKLDDADTAKGDAKYYYNQLKSLTQQLARNEAYNDAAKVYNQKAASFPVSLFTAGEARVFD